jgi:hypothetical protein
MQRNDSTRAFLSRRPRADPLGLLPALLPMRSRDLGEFAYPFMAAAIDGSADTTSRHILDLIGWVLTCREQNM